MTDVILTGSSRCLYHGQAFYKFFVSDGESEKAGVDSLPIGKRGWRFYRGAPLAYVRLKAPVSCVTPLIIRSHKTFSGADFFTEFAVW